MRDLSRYVWSTIRKCYATAWSSRTNLPSIWALVRPFDVATDAPDATPCDPTEQGEFQCLDTLTLCYIDTSCVVKNMLDKDELAWLNQYNKRVYDTLAPHLAEDDRTWLEEKCKAL